MKAEDNKEKQGAGPLSAPPCSALAAPDSPGYWWLMAFGKMDWELIKVTDFGDGRLSAGAVSRNWFGLTIGHGFNYSQTQGMWVKIHKPNDEVSHGSAEKGSK